MLVAQSNFIDHTNSLVSSLQGEMGGKSGSVSYAFSSPLLFIKPTLSKALQNFRPFKHLHHFEPLKFHKHFEPLPHFRPLKHLKHFKPFKYVNTYLLSGLAFAYLTATSLNDAKQSYASMQKVKQQLRTLEIIAAKVNAPNEISAMRKFFTSQLDSAKQDLAIRVGLVAAGVIGMIGCALNAPAILLVATGATAVLTGISIIKAISEYSNEGQNQANAARMIFELKAMQKSAEADSPASDDMDYDSFENTDYDGSPLKAVQNEQGQQVFSSSNPETYYLHQEPRNN